MCATYMQITNMPVEYKPKLDNVYLVAICNSANLKSDDTPYNFIAEKIVSNIALLQKNGIAVDGRNIKGSLIHVACDNLGANMIFGFTESFSATYCCRHCECAITECQKLTNEVKGKMRTIESYEKLADIAENIAKLDLKKTKGIKKTCKFNDLEYYHIIILLTMCAST